MKILLLDIETAPNLVAVYALKQKYINPKLIVSHGYVLCFAAKWLGRKGTYFAKSPDGHVDMLKRVHKLLSECDAVVHYYGKKFDLPTLNSEFIMHGLPPIENLVQIDLCIMVRRTFNFPSYKLDYVCPRLGLGGKTKHQGWEMWKACMDNLHKGHAKAWKTMERYNKGDVILLARLYKRVRPWFNSTYGFKRVSEYLEGKREKP